ncbi:MAG: iron uptake transporter deferrochelatase/peroxidase subunit [Actinomycetota bacterium]
MDSISRRNLIKGIAATGALLGAGAVGGRTLLHDESPESLVPFFGKHQSGITTPHQRNLRFVSLDLSTTKKDDVVELLKRWTLLASTLTAGSVESKQASYDSPPVDTGEVLGSASSNLSITFGFGPTLFQSEDGVDRFGISGQSPKDLVQLPALPRDQIIPGASHGDLCIQVCADDPQVSFHASRNLIREAFGIADLRWAQAGFLGKFAEASHTTTPRNLLGFKDGTANPKTSVAAEMDADIWIDDPSEPQWLQGGAYLAVRKIKNIVETWDRTSLREQENIIGRTKSFGAPLSGGDEFTEIDLKMKNGKGEFVVPEKSHVRIAHPDNNAGRKMLRRGFNYDDGSDFVGRTSAGLFFMAYQKSLSKNFIPVLQSLASQDALNEYISHIGTGVFAIPSGVLSRNDFIGQQLF